MNTRRGFIGSILKAGAACAVLPAAATYGRTWKRTSEVWVPGNFNKYDWYVAVTLHSNTYIQAWEKVLACGKWEINMGQTVKA